MTSKKLTFDEKLEYVNMIAKDMHKLLPHLSMAEILRMVASMIDVEPKKS